MLQGTGSDVGKSLLVTGLCRLFANRGLAVRPFKPQNMSNNAAVTPGGGEIGRAQALQAKAGRIVPSVEMNPVLLKPETDTGAQVILRGRRAMTLKAKDYQAHKPKLLEAVLESFADLGKDADLLLVEGAGSPAEVNLRQGDIANMGFAEAADVPVVLIGDIDRGGVIASLVGTREVIGVADQKLIKGFIINRFRGDPRLFNKGLEIIREHTDWPCLGVVPHLPAATRLPAEDAVVLERGSDSGSGRVKIAVPRFSRIANFDDFDPLRLEVDVTLQMVPPGEALPGDADLVILPGSKSTLGDLAFLRVQGWDIDIVAHLRRGGRVLGVCAGYQMLGRRLHDPDGLDGPKGSVDGLGLLDIESTMTGDKRLVEVQGKHRESGMPVRGYEMHLGMSKGPDLERPLLEIEGRPEGAVSKNGRVAGCYLHGLFADDSFRRSFLTRLGCEADSGIGYEAEVDSVLDALADHLENHLDIEALLTIAKAR